MCGTRRERWGTDMQNTFRLQVITPEKAFVDQPASKLIFETSDGEMAVLPGHTPMIATLEVGPVRFEADGKTREFAASEGFVIVEKGQVLLMAQTAEWPEDIDLNRAQRQQELAQERLRQQRSQQEYIKARALLTRAMVRMRLGRSRHPRNDAP